MRADQSEEIGADQHQDLLSRAEAGDVVGTLGASVAAVLTADLDPLR
jgi:hypothetical protein